jgi:uncharacterized membrane protein YtjA (UPF0391 family)
MNTKTVVIFLVAGFVGSLLGYGYIAYKANAAAQSGS